jgi:hypothetical protein
MQAAEGADAPGAGAQVQVIGICEDDLRTQIVEIPMRHGFHRALRAHGHERGRLHGTVRRRQHASPRGAVGVRHRESE